MAKAGCVAVYFILGGLIRTALWYLSSAFTAKIEQNELLSLQGPNTLLAAYPLESLEVKLLICINDQVLEAQGVILAKLAKFTA